MQGYNQGGRSGETELDTGENKPMERANQTCFLNKKFPNTIVRGLWRQGSQLWNFFPSHSQFYV